VRIIYPVLNLDWVILIRVCDMALFAATVWALALVALALDEANVVAVEASAPAAGLCDGNYVFTTLHPPTQTCRMVCCAAWGHTTRANHAGVGRPLIVCACRQ
jgi:hypothetical protein